MDSPKPETETMPVVVDLPANIHRFLGKMAELQGLTNVADLLRYNALQDVEYYVRNGGGETAIEVLADHLNIDVDGLKLDNVYDYIKLKAKESSEAEPTTGGITKVHIEGESVVTLKGKDFELFEAAMRVTGLDADKTAKLAIAEFLSTQREHEQFNGREEQERKKLKIES